MKDNLLHIYRNSPYGRETLLQSAYFCKKMNPIQLNVFLPQSPQFLFYFEREVVTVDLDASYMNSPDSARERVIQYLDEAEIDYHFYETKDFTASGLPNLSTNMAFMTCPRSLVESNSPIGLGYVGSRIRRMAKNAHFPILIPSPCYKEWNAIVSLYDGSRLGHNAVRTAFHVADRTGLPLMLFTFWERQYSNSYEKSLAEGGFLDRVKQGNILWKIFENGELEDHLFHVPQDALVVVGAAGHSHIKELIFGGRLERIQRYLPNPILVVGPHCTPMEEFIEPGDSLTQMVNPSSVVG